jgi:hypothetical protein
MLHPELMAGTGAENSWLLKKQMSRKYSRSKKGMTAWGGHMV